MGMQKMQESSCSLEIVFITVGGAITWPRVWNVCDNGRGVMECFMSHAAVPELKKHIFYEEYSTCCGLSKRNGWDVTNE